MEKRKFPHAEKTLPREDPTESHSALVGRTQHKRMSAVNTKQERLPKGHTTLKSPWPAAATGLGQDTGHTHTEELHIHMHTRVDPRVGKGLGEEREHHGGLQELHLWEWI